MNSNVDIMVTDYIVFSKIPVKGKCQAGNRAVHFIPYLPGIPGVCKKGSNKGFWMQVLYMKIVIIDYIRSVVKMPGSMKGVGINGKNKKKQESKDYQEATG